MSTNHLLRYSALCIGLIILLHSLGIREFAPYRFIPPPEGLLLRWGSHVVLALSSLLIKAFQRKRGNYREMLSMAIWPVVLSLISIVSGIHILDSPYNNAAESPLIQASRVISMGACIIAGSLFYGCRHKIEKLLSLGIIIAGSLWAIIGDSEALFPLVGTIISIVNGVSTGVLLISIKNRLDSFAMLDFMIAFYSATSFGMLGISLFYARPAEWFKLGKRMFAPWAKFGIMLPLQVCLEAVVLLLLFYGTPETYLVIAAFAWIPSTVIAGFVFELDIMLASLKGAFLILFGVIMYMWVSQEKENPETIVS